jgi:hypothetical protein
MGISNGIATICGFVSPMVAGAIVNDNVSIRIVCKLARQLKQQDSMIFPMVSIVG